MVMDNATDAAIVGALEQLTRDPEEAGTYVVLEGDATRNYYLQFACVDELLLCEAVSNRFLDEADQLDGAQITMLEQLGWRLDEDGGNWACAFVPGPQGFAAIVALVRRTFTDAYGLPGDAPLRMQDAGDEEPPTAVPVLRLVTEAGDVRDDPSEDGLLLYVGDLDAGNQWLTVQRLDAPFDRFRVDYTDADGRVDVSVEGDAPRSRQGVTRPVAHALLTAWASPLG